MNGGQRISDHQLRDLADRVRDIPLRELLRSHGFEIKSGGATFRATNDRHNIVVTGNHWFDNKAGLGGLGAIDLQMHLTGEDLAAACQTLATDFRAVSTAQIGLSFPLRHCLRPDRERKPFHELAARYAVPKEANWPIARAYLVETRGIEPAIVDDLHAVGTIFANDHRPNPSIVFLHRTQYGKVGGASLRDTRQQSSFRPCLGNKLSAWFTVGHLDKAEIVIAVESPIDGLYWEILVRMAAHSNPPANARMRILSSFSPTKGRRSSRARNRRSPIIAKQHPQVHFHYTPTHASWLNQVEIWFSILTEQALRGASFRSVKELVAAIDAFIKAYNETAAPFQWAKVKVSQKSLASKYSNLIN